MADNASLREKAPESDSPSSVQQTQPLETTAAPPPDGGLVAWLQVLAGHFVVFNTWGYIISFGIFQPYYEDVLSLEASAVSWVGSIQICLIFLVGTFSGRMFDAGYYRALNIVGIAMQLVGIFTTSVSTKYWHLFLAQGLCQGMGCGMIFAPMIANIATYFSRRRSVAMTIAACGGATGGIVFPLIAQQLLHRTSFGWTVRAMGFVELSTYIVVLAVTRTRLAPRRTGPLVDLSAFKDLTYVFFAIATFFTLWATYFAYYYARAYAVEKLGATQDTSFNMLMVINAVGIPGRLIPGYLADRYFGAVTMFIPTVFCAGICVFAWAGVESVTGLYVWIAFLGYFGAGIQGMFPASLSSLSKDLSKGGVRIGMIFTIVSVAALTGPPLAGKLMEINHGKYIGAQVWGGVCLLIGTAMLIAARVASRRKEVQE